MMNFKKLKPKGLERHKVKWQIKFDSRLRGGAEKPEIDFSLSDYWKEFLMWFEGFAIEAGSKIIRNIIPGWFWIALLVVVVILILVIL